MAFYNNNTPNINISNPDMQQQQQDFKNNM